MAEVTLGDDEATRKGNDANESGPGRAFRIIPARFVLLRKVADEFRRYVDRFRTADVPEGWHERLFVVDGQRWRDRDGELEFRITPSQGA